MFFVFFACSMDQAIRGFPQKFLIFFFGIVLEPQRASIIATLFLDFMMVIIQKDHLLTSLHQHRYPDQ